MKGILKLNYPLRHMRSLLLLSSVLALGTGNLSGQNRISLHAQEPQTIISKHIYGHFAEHLGRCIYGGFYVGEDNNKVAHVNGVRKDVIDALIKLKVPNLRWPGGCFADTYHWKDGVGPKKNRPTIVNQWWGGVTEDNSFGTHDFLNMLPHRNYTRITALPFAIIPAVLKRYL